MAERRAATEGRKAPGGRSAHIRQPTGGADFGVFRVLCRCMQVSGSGQASKCLLRRQAGSQRDTAHQQRVKPGQGPSGRVWRPSTIQQGEDE